MLEQVNSIAVLTEFLRLIWSNKRTVVMLEIMRNGITCRQAKVALIQGHYQVIP